MKIRKFFCFVVYVALVMWITKDIAFDSLAHLLLFWSACCSVYRWTTNALLYTRITIFNRVIEPFEE